MPRHPKPLPTHPYHLAYGRQLRETPKPATQARWTLPEALQAFRDAPNASSLWRFDGDHWYPIAERSARGNVELNRLRLGADDRRALATSHVLTS